MLVALAGAMNVSAKVIMPRPPLRPLPMPVVTVGDLRQNETNVVVETKETVSAENAFFKCVKVNLTFTNPNSRVMSGELEFPIPDGAFVCGYALEINGDMTAGLAAVSDGKLTSGFGCRFCFGSNFCFGFTLGFFGGSCHHLNGTAHQQQ